MIKRNTTFGQWLLFIVLMLTASVAWAALPALHTGTYSYTVIKPGTAVGPVVYDTASPLGDGYAGANEAFGNGSNQIGSDGVELIFDLGQPYTIIDVESFHSVPKWYGLSVADFYYSTDGTNYTLLGSDGDTIGSQTVNYGVVSRFYDYDNTVAQYIKIHIHSKQWYSLYINEIQIRTQETPTGLYPLIAGLDGARHWLWVEAEDFDWNVGFGSGFKYANTISGFKSNPPQLPNRLDGNYQDRIGYDAAYFALPADMPDATFYAFYGCWYNGKAGYVYLDNANVASVPLIDNDPTSNEYGSVPRSWTDPVSLGALTGGLHQFEYRNSSNYNEDSYDGFLFVDGECILPNNASSDGVWYWRQSPQFDPNTVANIPGDSVTATVTISDPVEQWSVYVDDILVAGPFTDPCVYDVTIEGPGVHYLEVEAYRKQSTIGEGEEAEDVVHGRVLAGAFFKLITCGWNNEFLPGDINQDCYIDLQDFALMQQNWMVAVDPCDPNAGVVLNPDPLPAAIPTAFPIGWYTSGTAYQLVDLAADGFNCVTPYGGSWAYMNLAQENQMGVIRYISGTGQNLTDFVNEYKQAPALWYWNLYDEPIGGGNPQNITEFAANYNTVKAADPCHPVTAVFCMSNLGSYINYVDFPMFDRYPISYGEAVPAPDLYRVASETKLVAQQAASAGKGAPIFVAQAMGGYNNTYREPTFDEQRYMTFAPVTVGARGILYYSRFDVSAAHYPNVVTIAGQLADVVPALESAYGTGGLVASSNHDSDTTGHGVNDITYVLYYLPDDVYLIAVNNTGAAINGVTFTIANLPVASYTAEVLYESRSINLVGSTLTDDFDPYEVHIYKGSAN